MLLKTYRKSGHKACAQFSAVANLGRIERGPTVPMGTAKVYLDAVRVRILGKFHWTVSCKTNLLDR